MKTFRLKYTIIVLLTLIGLVSCDDMFEERIDGNNVMVSSVRDISAFDEIESTGKFDVYLTIADSTSLRIEAEENLLPFITTRVSGQKFYVEVKEDYKINNFQSIKIFITTPNIEGAKLTGSGIILCDTLNTDFLSLELTGSGSIRTLDLIHDNCYSRITGSGNIYVHAENYLNVEITRLGNIYYLGNPIIAENITGTGDVKRY